MAPRYQQGMMLADQAPSAATADYRRQRALAEQLMAMGATGAPVYTPMQGLAQLGTTLVGAYAGRKADEALAQSREADRQTKAALLASALRAGTTQAPRSETFQDGTTINWEGRKGNPEEMAAILAGNPLTAETGLSLQLQNLEAEREQQLRASERAAENETWRSRYDVQSADRLAAEEREATRSREAQDRLFAQQQKLLSDRLGANGEGDFGKSTRGKVLSVLSNALSTGQTNTPEYAAAWAEFSQPKPAFDPNTGEMRLIRPDLSMFPRPSFAGAPQADVAANVTPVAPTAPAAVSPAAAAPSGPSTAVAPAPAVIPVAAPPPIVENLGGGPVPGSRAAAAALEADKIAKAKMEAANAGLQTADVVLQDIRKLRGMVQKQDAFPGITGVGGSLAANIPGTDRSNAEALAETIRANIGFDRLQQMRDASPTGGALGAVTREELNSLQSVLGNLAFSQSADQLERNLERLESTYGNIMRKFEAYPGVSKPAPSKTAPTSGGWSITQVQ